MIFSSHFFFCLSLFISICLFSLKLNIFFCSQLAVIASERVFLCILKPFHYMYFIYILARIKHFSFFFLLYFIVQNHFFISIHKQRWACVYFSDIISLFNIQHSLPPHRHFNIYPLFHSTIFFSHVVHTADAVAVEI